MSRNQHAAQILFALGMINLGILAIVYSAFGLVWYSVPTWVPWREMVAGASAIILLGGGAGLLFTRTARLSACILLSYLLIWLLLRVPALAAAPLTEVNWQNAGELAVLVAGAWVLLARMAEARAGSKVRFVTSETGARIARFLFAVSLLAFGLSHFVYAGQTAGLVPTWLPFRTDWAYVTGAAHLAAGIGVLFSIYPRLAATMEAAMLSVFTLLVWVPAVLAASTSAPTWTEFLISWAITAGAWVVAESIPAQDITKTGPTTPRSLSTSLRHRVD
jgi:uncharacterized membrane protein